MADTRDPQPPPMGEPELIKAQAEQMERILPSILRRLFTLDPDNPVAEMPVAQLRVCTILQHGPRSMSAVSEELGISVSAMTQIADRMERGGLVERMSGQDDRRCKQLQLTAYGQELMYSRRQMRVQRAAEALEYLSAEERIATLNVLHGLFEASLAISAPVREDPIGARQEH